MVDGRIRLERRSLVDGSLDWAVESDPTAGDDVAETIVTDGTFAYLLVRSESVGELRIEKRSLADGSLADFEANTVNFEDEAMAGDGEFLYVSYGQEIAPGNHEWVIEKRSMLDLELDATFDGDGKLEIDPSSAWEAPHGIGASNGVIYVTGTDQSGPDLQWRIEARYR